MKVTLRSIGDSKVVVIAKPLLARIGLSEATVAEVTVENDAIVLRRAVRPARMGWAEAAKALAAQGDDALVMGEFGNESEAESQGRCAGHRSDRLRTRTGGATRKS